MSDMQQLPKTTLERSFPTVAKLLGRARVARLTPKPKAGKEAAPKLPIVNLLPPRLAMEKALRNIRRGFLLSGAVIIGLAAAVWVGQAAAISSAQNDLNQAVTQLDTSTRTLAGMKSQVAFFDALDYRIKLEKATLAGQVDFSKILGIVDDALPGNASVASLEIQKVGTETAAPGDDKDLPGVSACGPISDPFAQGGERAIACLKFNGSVSDRSTLAKIGEILNNTSLLSNVSVVQTSAGDADGRVSYTVTATINVSASVATGTIPATGGTN